MTLDAKPCPLCEVWSVGWPRPVWGGLSTEEQPDAWQYRLDLGEFVCPRCNAGLGEDTVRARILAKIEAIRAS